MFKNGGKTNHYLILGGVDNQMTNFEFLVYIFQSFDTLPIHFNHGLRTPNEGIKQQYLKNWADVADKICFGRT